ncbi:MAG: AccI family restriction endonuclease [Candidatus Omnitrophota bacterium]
MDMKFFEEALNVPMEEIEFELRGFEKPPWLDYFLNPRRLRGSDFLMRWSQGVWSEKRIIQAVNETDEYFAVPYGPSGTAPTDDVRAYELYFERLDQAGLGKVKRPDLLIYDKKDQKPVNEMINNLGGIEELPFIKEEQLDTLVEKAIIAVECENSLWIAEKMPDFNTPLTPQKRLNGKQGLKKNAVLPTVIIKEEDREPLVIWQDRNRIKIHIWH